MPHNSRIIAAFLAALLLLLAPATAWAYRNAYRNGDYEYIFEEDGSAVITEYYGELSEVTLVEILEGYKELFPKRAWSARKVTDIGSGAFSDQATLTAITLPDSLQRIGYSAFSHCKALTTVTLPAGLQRIGDWAFSSCDNLTGLVLPEGLESIGKGAFSSCDSLDTLMLPDSLTSMGSNPFQRAPTDIIVSPAHPFLEVRDGVLFEKPGKLLIAYPYGSDASTYTVPEGTRAIGEKAFYFCDKLKSVTIPASVNAIGKDAFALCPELVLRVERDSYAAVWAGTSTIPCEYSDTPGVPAILPSPPPAPTAEPEPESNENSEVNPILLLNGEAVIPEDFPNIFNTYTSRLYNLEQRLDVVDFAETSVNGRIYLFPAVWSSKEIGVLYTNRNLGDLFFESNVFELNYNFFNTNDYVRFNGIRSFADTLEYLNIDINADSLSQLRDCLENRTPMPIPEFIELYKSIIPKEMLPIKLERPTVNLNPTIPKFAEEFLNKPFDIKKLAAIVITGNKPEPALIAFCEAVGEDKGIGSIISLDLHDVFSKDFELDTGLASKSNIVKEKGFDKKYSYDYSIELGYSLELIGEHFPAMVEPLLAVKTYGDLLEVYQMLPLDVQRQYKESDFKDNPYVDPAWWAERPYVELSIGSSGQEVLDLKQRFLELGYFRTTSFNDRFTDSTADTVRLFEKKNGLPVDGVADAVMLGVLFSDKAVPKR